MLPQQLLPGEVAPAQGEQSAWTLQGAGRVGGESRPVGRQFPLQGIGFPAAFEVTLNDDK